MLNKKMVIGIIIGVILIGLVGAYIYNEYFYENCNSMSEWTSMYWTAQSGKCKTNYNAINGTTYVFNGYYTYSPFYDTRNSSFGNISFSYSIRPGRRQSTTMALYEHDGMLGYNLIWLNNCPTFAGSCAGNKVLPIAQINLTNNRYKFTCSQMSESSQYCSFDDFYIYGYDTSSEYKNESVWIINCTDVSNDGLVIQPANLSGGNISFRSDDGTDSVTLGGAIKDWTQVHSAQCTIERQQELFT